jgi:hypothetical protein
MISYKFKENGSLASNFYQPQKPFKSMHACKKQKPAETIKDNAEREYIKSYGLLIVRHKERLEPFKIEKTTTNRLYYDYFEKHKDCKETSSFYDIKNPQILRYWTRYNSINKNQSFRNKKEWNFY